MTHTMKDVLKNRQGAVIPIVAVCIVVLVGFAAIAIDIGMLFDSRAEAQRAADAAALAGASALLEFRDQPQSVKRDSATERALLLAGMNDVRGTPVLPAEVAVEFLQSDARIAATVTRSGIAPLFATIFGVSSLQVAATAHAMYYQGGAANCLKPFGLPDDFFSLSDVGDLIMIWKKSTHDTYPLITQLIAGNNVRDALESLVCNPTVIAVGQEITRPMTPPVTGQVLQGLDFLIDADPGLSYDPSSPATHPYEGFNDIAWRSSPRVLNVVLYNPATVTSNSFFVSGFLTIFLSEPTRSLPMGDHEQWGILLPHRPIAGGGPCTPPNCSALSWALRLVQ